MASGSDRTQWSGAPNVEAQPGDKRLVAGAAERNKAVIAEAMAARFGEARGTALEIGAGTGQHAAAIAPVVPGLTWIPSEPSAAARESIAAWAASAGAANLADPIELDAAADWPAAVAGALRLVFSANVIHVAPWRVAEGIFRGSGRALGPEGALALYGPFMEAGAHNSEGNVRFDASLRAEDPSWGIRDLVDLDRLGAAAGLFRIETVAMPANNRLLIYRRAG